MEVGIKERLKQDKEKELGFIHLLKEIYSRESGDRDLWKEKGFIYSSMVKDMRGRLKEAWSTDMVPITIIMEIVMPECG